MDVFLSATEGEPEVDHFEDSVLTGPENVARLEVSMDDIVAVEGEDGDENVLGKLETCPGRQTASIIFVNYLNRIFWSGFNQKYSKLRESLIREIRYSCKLECQNWRISRPGNNAGTAVDQVGAFPAASRHITLSCVSAFQDNFSSLKILENSFACILIFKILEVQLKNLVLMKFSNVLMTTLHCIGMRSGVK